MKGFQDNDSDSEGYNFDDDYHDIFDKKNFLNQCFIC